MPGWALNVTVDELLKKEFDLYRKEQKPHPIMIKHKLNFVPYQHKDLDTWRNSLKGGISYLDQKTNLVIYGGIDDLWFESWPCWPPRFVDPGHCLSKTCLIAAPQRPPAAGLMSH